MENMNRILAVEDASCQLIVLKIMLQPVFPDAIIDTADTYEDAIELINQNQYDLFLLDIELTEDRSKNGFAIATYAREHPENQSAPIVFVTAMSASNQEEVPQFKNSCYLIKPYDVSHLISSIKSAAEPAIDNSVCLPVNKMLCVKISYLPEELYYVKFGIFHNYIHNINGIIKAYPHPSSEFLPAVPETFWMCGMRYLINSEKIESYDQKSHKAKIKDIEIRIPRKYRKMVEEKFC